MLHKIKAWANVLKIELPALSLALKRHETPLSAKLIIAITLGYALSPIDLIPDFIPILGYLDDLILLPLFIALAIRLIPEHIMSECRDQVSTYGISLKKNWWYATPILILWLIVFLGVFWILAPEVSHKSNHNALITQEASDGEGTDDLRLQVMITSDLHYLSPKLTDQGMAFQTFVATGDGKNLTEIDTIVDTLCAEARSSETKLLILSGDLTNNGEKQSHIDLAQKLSNLEKDGVEVIVIPGNHDILNPYARRFKNDAQIVVDSVSPDAFATIYSDFGYNQAYQRDSGSLSYLYTPNDKLWFLMLDTNQYENNMTLGYPQVDGELSADTLAWIQSCLTEAKSKGAKVITIMHHNALDHSDVIRDGFTLNNHEALVALLKKNGVNLVFSGHIHIQDIGTDNREGLTLYDVASNALSVYPNQYGIMNYVYETSELNYHTKRLDVEAWATEQGVTDTHLLNFKTDSEAYFGGFAFDMALKRLAEVPQYSEAEIQTMSEAMALLNLHYFAGTEEENIDIKGMNLWENAPESFLKQYVFSIFEDDNLPDNTYCDISKINLDPITNAVISIETNYGTIETDRVVNSAGAWAPDLGKLVGINIPIEPRKGTNLVSEQTERLCNNKILEYGYMMSKFDSINFKRNVSKLVEEQNIAFNIEYTKANNLLIGGNRLFRGFDIRSEIETMKAISERALRFFPELEDIKCIRTYSGVRPFVIDHLPIVSDVDSVPGYYIAAGHEGDGICFSPITGRFMSQIILGEATDFDISKLDFARFEK